MCVIDIIKSTREELGLKQRDVAERIGLALSTYGAYERKDRPIPDDIVYAVANELGNPYIIAEYTFERHSDFFNVPILDRVDDYPQVVIDCLAEESNEMDVALIDIKKLIKNKHTMAELTPKEFELLICREEQVGDLYAALKMHFITMKKYGVDVKEIELRCNRKLINKGYVSGNRQKKKLLRATKV